jgi:hypothetical protein
MISIICPSRGRPMFSKRMVGSIKSTSSGSIPIEYKFYLNDDDPELENYKKNLDPTYYDIGPNRSTCFSWNKLAKQSQGDILMLAGDDVQFTTPDWDLEVQKIFDMYEDKIAMVIPNDGRGLKKNHGDKYRDINKPVWIGDEPCPAPHFFVHRRWIEILGYLAPPMFWHFYVDTYTQKVSRKLNRCVLLPHVEVKAKKLFDSTAKQVRGNLRIAERDDWVWTMVRNRHLMADVELLKQHLK